MAPTRSLQNPEVFAFTWMKEVRNGWVMAQSFSQEKCVGIEPMNPLAHVLTALVKSDGIVAGKLRERLQGLG